MRFDGADPATHHLAHGRSPDLRKVRYEGRQPPGAITHLFYMATKAKTKAKTKTKRRRWLTLKDALRNVRKEHPGLSLDLQRRIAQRNVTLDELASHVERYREEHAT